MGWKEGNWAEAASEGGDRGGWAKSEGGRQGFRERTVTIEGTLLRPLSRTRLAGGR